jgi:hypothetical protein
MLNYGTTRLCFGQSSAMVIQLCMQTPMKVSAFFAKFEFAVVSLTSPHVLLSKTLSAKGHRWNLRVNGEIVQKWVIHGDAEQVYRV